MTQLFTPYEQVLRYLYRETGQAENEALESELLLNNYLAEYTAELLLLKNTLRNIELHPSDGTSDRILAYAKKKSIAA